MARFQTPLSSRSGDRSLFWPAVGALLALYTTAAMVHVHTRLSLVELGYQLSQQVGLQRQLQSQWRHMSIEVATLRHPRRLRSVATAQLGLVEPTAAQMVATHPPQPPAGGKKRR